MNKIKVLELFGGIASFSKGLERNGIPYEIVDYVDIDKYATQAFNAIHGTNYEPQDITQWDKDIEVDMVCHGSPCFRAGELVNTDKGLISIENIRIGDVVRTAEGNYKKVVETMVSVNDRLIDVKPTCAHCINTTENHPFWVLREGQTQWVQAGDLTTKDYLIVPINKKAEQPRWEGCDLFYNGHTEHSCKLPLEDGRFWYLIGRFIGDGWVTRRKSRNNNISGIKICCAKDELVELETRLGGVLPYCVIEDRTVYKLQFCNKELGTFCEQFGIGAVNKHIPQNILDLDKRYLQPLYEGLMESDGYAQNERCKYTSISKELVYNVAELVLKLKETPYSVYKTLRPRCTMIEGRVVNQHDSYTVAWSEGGTLDRIHFVKDGYLFSRVRKIRSLDGSDTVYNLEVEDEHTYCVDNVAVHNCQDYSVAGRGAGGDKGSGTRSSLMWHTVRIVEKLKPKYVLWENVKNLLSKKHRHNFDAYIQTLDELGYNSYYQVLNAKKYGVPQNRERVFTVSIRKDIDKGFEFPVEIPLQHKLKDVLEADVDEKFYLSQERVEKIKFSTYNASNYASRVRSPEGESRTLAARDYKDPTCVQVGTCEAINGNDILKRIYSADGIAPTCNTCGGGNTETKIIDPQGLKVVVGDNEKSIEETPAVIQKQGDRGTNNYSVSSETSYTIPANPMSDRDQKVVEPFIVASRGRNPDNPSDRTVGAPTEQRLEAHTDGISNTLTSVQKDNYVGEFLPVKNSTAKGYLEGKPYDGIYTNIGNKRGTVQPETSQTLTRLEDKGVILPGLRVRKLTPKEYWRLMNRDDWEFDKAKASGISNSQLYKIAGNSIVVACPTAIFAQLFCEHKWNDMTDEERQKLVESEVVND